MVECGSYGEDYFLELGFCTRPQHKIMLLKDQPDERKIENRHINPPVCLYKDMNNCQEVHFPWLSPLTLEGIRAGYQNPVG